jgi:hypothetical protein
MAGNNWGDRKPVIGGPGTKWISSDMPHVEFVFYPLALTQRASLYGFQIHTDKLAICGVAQR